jgi:hypothetical protein
MELRSKSWCSYDIETPLLTKLSNTGQQGLISNKGDLCCAYDCHDVDGVLSYSAVLVTTVSQEAFDDFASPGITVTLIH